MVYDEPPSMLHTSAIEAVDQARDLSRDHGGADLCVRVRHRAAIVPAREIDPIGFVPEHTRA